MLAQASMTLLQVFGGLWLLGQVIGFMSPNLGVPVLLMVAGIVGGPVVEWSCRLAARGPARRYGLEAERRLREAAGGCGRARVLDPVAAELLRYREVREQYAKVMGPGLGLGPARLGSAREPEPGRERGCRLGWGEGGPVRVTELSTTGR
uniref:ATP-binding protein n=1 Tax=Streptomyces avermitilis TaxID=33903 RepID=A0A499VGM8_STRAX|nr:hypothetical protein SAVMC3_61330 [Streptomyces avermitilis]